MEGKEVWSRRQCDEELPAFSICEDENFLDYICRYYPTELNEPIMAD